MTPIPNDSSETTRLLQQLISQALNQARDSNALGSEDLQQLDPELFTRSVQSSPPPSILAPQRLYQSGTDSVVYPPKTNDNTFTREGNTYTGEYKYLQTFYATSFSNTPVKIPHGKGTMNYRAGYKDPFYPKTLSKYEGNWKDGEFNGWGGVLTFTDGSTLSGKWEDGRLQGSGVLKFPNGTGIMGEWYSGILMKGIQTFSNGACYRGTFTPCNLHQLVVTHESFTPRARFYSLYGDTNWLFSVPTYYTPFGDNDWSIQIKDGYYFKIPSTIHIDFGMSFGFHEKLYPISKASGIYRDGIYTEIIHPEPTCCCSIL